MLIEFEWDRAKAESNLRKHGVNFKLAAFVFSDPFLLIEEDRVEEDEVRWLAVGAIPGPRLIAVAHTIRWRGDAEVTRIISARKANRYERARYEDQVGAPRS